MHSGRKYALDKACPQLGNQFFIVTVSGRLFKKVKHDPKLHLGTIHLNENGSSYEIIWGFMRIVARQVSSQHIFFAIMKG